MADINAENTTPSDQEQTSSGQKALSSIRMAESLDGATADLLMRMYLARRIEYQIEFYRNRIREFDNNSDLMFRLGALVMSLSSLFAALSLQADSPVLRLITAILPAFAALVASFRQLYQWERQAGIYRDSILGLEDARLVVPDTDKWQPNTALNLYSDLVRRAEQVFKDEVGQWGQVALGKTEGDAKDDAIRAFAEEYGLDVFNPDGSIDESRIGTLKDILAASQGAPSTQIEIGFPEIGAGKSYSGSDIEGEIIDNEAMPMDEIDEQQDVTEADITDEEDDLKPDDAAG